MAATLHNSVWVCSCCSIPWSTWGSRFVLLFVRSAKIVMFVGSGPLAQMGPPWRFAFCLWSQFMCGWWIPCWVWMRTPLLCTLMSGQRTDSVRQASVVSLLLAGNSDHSDVHFWFGCLCDSFFDVDSVCGTYFAFVCFEFRSITFEGSDELREFWWKY